MNLLCKAPIPPILAKRIASVPKGDNWIYEPKWDGFRTLVFRDGDELLLQSGDLKPLNRYFPELPEPLARQLPRHCVLDGEIVIAHNGTLDFDALQLRIHPAASRVKQLSKGDSCLNRLLRSTVQRDERLAEQTVLRTPARTGEIAVIRFVSSTPNASYRRFHHRRRLVSSLRRSRPGRNRRETKRREIRA